MKKLSRQYIAGFFDGEGCLTLGKRKCNFGYNSACYIAMLDITNTNKEIIEILSQQLKMHIIIHQKGQPHHKVRYRITIHNSAKRLKKAIEYMLPFLVIKKPQAKLMLKYIKTIKPGSPSGVKLSDEIIKKRKKMYKEMRKLNNRGQHCIVK